MPTYTQLAVDTFNRADENPINPANWATFAPLSDLQVLSNLCKASQVSQNSGALYTGVVFPDDQYAEAMISQLTSDGELSILVRANHDLTSGYLLGINAPTSLGSSDCDIELYRANENEEFALFTGVLNINDTIRLEALGKSIAVKLNGVVIISVCDSFASSGAPGLAISDSVTIDDASFCHFAAGEISAL